MVHVLSIKKTVYNKIFCWSLADSAWMIFNCICKRVRMNEHVCLLGVRGTKGHKTSSQNLNVNLLTCIEVGLNVRKRGVGDRLWHRRSSFPPSSSPFPLWFLPLSSLLSCFIRWSRQIVPASSPSSGFSPKPPNDQVPPSTSSHISH